MSCDDGNSCTTDGCAPATGCIHVTLEDGAVCSDGKYCTVNDACVSGTCVGQARDCSGSVTTACQKAGCDEASSKCGAVPAPDGDSCDDNDICTTGDKCAAGKCAGTKKSGCSTCAITADCPTVVCVTALCNDQGTCDYLPVAGCDAGVGMGDAGDAGVGAESGAESDGGGNPNTDASVSSDAAATNDAGSLPDGNVGTPMTGADASGSEADGGFFQTAPFGSCSCEVVGGSHQEPSSNGPWRMAALSMLALGMTLRRRRSRSERVCR
jgi:hypothetical protein